MKYISQDNIDHKSEIQWMFLCVNWGMGEQIDQYAYVQYSLPFCICHI